MRAILAAGILSMVLVGPSTAQDKKAPAFITDVGEYKLYDGKLTIRIEKSKNWLHVTFDVAGSALNFGRIREIEKCEGWFVYPISESEVAVYEGGDLLGRFWYKRPPGPMPIVKEATFTIIQTRGEEELLKILPKQVVEKLPASFRK